MRKKLYPTLCLSLCACLITPILSRADSVLEFQVREHRTAPITNQSIAIKDGQIMIKAAGGNKNVDLLYSRTEEKVVIVDHKKRSLMTVNEQEVTRVSQEAQGFQPLIQGFSEQIAKMSPAERKKWQELLGDSVSLDTIAQASAPLAPPRMVPMGASKVAGIRCQEMQVMQGQTPLAEVCLAESAAMQLPGTDKATILSLFSFYEKLAARSQKMARQLGVSLPTLGPGEADGIPIKMLDLSRDDNMSVTLRNIKTAAVSPELMKIPNGFKVEPLSLWP